jgi:penicillin amidase
MHHAFFKYLPSKKHEEITHRPLEKTLLGGYSFRHYYSGANAMRAFPLIIAAVIAAIFPLHFYLQKRLPQKSGQLNLPGLSKSVSVTRDRFGIAHIEAENEVDAYRAFGYVAAGDRLFQMDLLRRIANGQLSEVLGPEMVEHDILLRKLRLRKTMDLFLEKNLSKLDPNMIELMRAFYDGVHHYMKTRPLPVEFSLLGYQPKPFELAEGMAISGYMALSFAEGIIADPLVTDLLSDFPKEMVSELFVRHKGDNNPIIQQLKKKGLVSAPWYQKTLNVMADFEKRFGLFHGSNSWVLAPSRSSSGGALLANDPHIAFSNPSVWYEAHLKTPNWELYGHYVPIVPFPALGHDRHRGWAVTMAEVDDLDLYEEKIDWENKTVLYKNQNVPLEIDRQIIKVKGGDDISLDVVITPHGPLIDGTEHGLKGRHLAIKWSYHLPDNDVASAFYFLSRSKNMKEMKEAIALAGTPGLNISWADADGNIGWHVMAKIPLRPPGVSGTQVLEGWSGKHEYLRYFTIDENPHQYNPSSGVLVTANYYPEYNPSGLPLEGYWQPAERFERLSSLLATKEKWDIEGLKSVQNDQTVVNLSHLLGPLLAGAKDGRTELEKTALTRLKKWDGKSDLQSIESSIFHMWLMKLADAIFLDEMGSERYRSYSRGADQLHVLKNILYQPDSKWWDDITTQERETREMIVARSLSETVNTLKSRLGPVITDWRWGKLHTITFAHPFGVKKPLNYIFNIGPYPAGGSFSQVDNMSIDRWEDSFNVTLGPSTRRLIDFSDAGKSLGVLPTGNSGQFHDAHYSDQTKLFLSGGYRAQWLDIPAMKKESHATLYLLPNPVPSR